MIRISAIVLFAVLFFGCGESDRQPLEKADRLSQQAFAEMNRQNYEEAEHLFAECIEIHSESNNESKLAEDYSALSTAQLLSGKLSPGVETLTALRGIYQRGADRNSELQTMLQIGKIYFQLGRTEEAFSIIREAYNNSRLFRLDQIAVTLALELSALYSKVDKHEKALTYAANAYQLCIEQQNGVKLVEALSLRIQSLAALGNVSAAFELFREASSIDSADDNINAADFYNECGNAFTRAEEWSFAKSLFEKALVLAERKRGLDRSVSMIEAKIGIGEIYFHHFAFAEAQQQFAQSYNLAKDGSDRILQAFLLLRVADCLAKRAANTDEPDGIIRATQLYEQAQTLFSRNGFFFGDAVTLHRLGMVKELTGDDNAAITFYKRAFDKFSDRPFDPRLYSLPIPIGTLYRTERSGEEPVEWFTRNLLSLLLKYKKSNEAYAYLQSARTLSLQSKVLPLMLRFKDPAKNNKFSAMQNTVLMMQQNVMELLHLNMMHQQTKNRNYANKLMQQFDYTKSKAQADAITLAQEFPAFSLFTTSSHSSQNTVLQAIPSSQVLLEYVFANNEAWVFIARQGEDLTSIKLSSYGYSLEKKMNRYDELLLSNAPQATELERLSNELYDVLIKPVEGIGVQRLIIIPPIQYERFPFHSLTDNGVPILEKIGITYLPHSAFLLSNSTLPKAIHAISAFGFTSNSRWGLEFELRDIRSFFKDIQLNVNQSATKQKLESSLGDVIQISSLYSITSDNEAWFTLSDGSTSKAGITLPVAQFASLYPFPIVYLSDVQSTSNNITALHPLLWLLNGSAAVITTQFPINPNVSKTFSEKFYLSLSSEMNPFLAYRRGVVQLGKKRELNGGFGGSAYFYYGVK